MANGGENKMSLQRQRRTDENPWGFPETLHARDVLLNPVRTLPVNDDNADELVHLVNQFVKGEHGLYFQRYSIGWEFLESRASPVVTAEKTSAASVILRLNTFNPSHDCFVELSPSKGSTYNQTGQYLAFSAREQSLGRDSGPLISYLLATRAKTFEPWWKHV
jgi:hypothetical protein